MYNQHHYQNAAFSLKQLFSCDITVVHEDTLIFSTLTDNYADLTQSAIINESYHQKLPIIINAPAKHAVCRQCSEIKNCRLILELCFPFFDSHAKKAIVMHFAENAQSLLNTLKLDHLLPVLKNYSHYLNFLCERQKLLQRELLLNQQLSYLADLLPEGLVFFDADKKLVSTNGMAEELKLANTFQNSQAMLVLNHELGRKKEFTCTLPHAEGDLQLHGRSFFSNKQFIGAVVHTKDYQLPKKLFPENEKNTAVLPQVIGKDPALLKVIDIVKQVAKSESTILLRGESGTGKERIAQTIHQLSSRSAGPFIAINCAAIPEHLLESELFGYEEGSFTGAKKGGKAGKIELADNGTLFLDEVGDMPLTLQVKLLRVIQEKCVDRIGATKPVPLNVRLVAATNQNLEKMIKEGTFREDLFFRLNVIPIYIPPLRERPGDIELLLNFYLKKYCLLLNKNFKVFSYSALQKLLSYHWPGNVRELENVVEYLVNINDKDIINIEDLPLGSTGTPVSKQSKHLTKVPANKKKRVRKEIIELLNTYGWDTEGKKRTAAHLKISLATLYRWLKKYNIKEQL